LLRQGTGEVAPTLFRDTLACAAGRCVLGGARTLVIDPEEPAQAQALDIKPTVQEAENIKVFADQPTTACDADGICLIVWLLLRETSFYDYSETDALGVLGRALDAVTGDLGGEALLVPTPDYVQDTLLENISPSEFVLALAVPGGIELRRLSVE
jgi:hypothetical protein